MIRLTCSLSVLLALLLLEYPLVSEALAGEAAGLQAAESQPGGTGADRPTGGESTHRASAVAARFVRIDFDALRRAIRDLADSFPLRYPAGEQYLRRLDAYEADSTNVLERLKQGDQQAVGKAEEILAFRREALLANPLLDFDKLLVVKRKPLGDPRRADAPEKGFGKFLGLPQQSSWQMDTIPQPFGWENEIALISSLKSKAALRPLYRPPTPRLLSDLELHFDAARLMFSMPDENHHWQVFEMDIDGHSLRQVSPAGQPDVHSFDSCYLPNGKIVYISTAASQGVPCNDAVVVGLLYIMDADGTGVRQLCFDQDHNYCPTLTNDGRILFLRWEYADLPHHWGRILFTMNPDGTSQREFYGSSSYWPNAIFYARSVPDHPTKVVGIVTGHHVGRVGELVLFDPALGRHEADGVVQRIPGYGQPVEPIIMDKLSIASWPKFLHPYPLSDKYFLVASKPRPEDLWGIYLVDVFDNILLLKEVEGYSLLEPIPLRKRNRPPVIPDRADLRRSDAIVYMEDVYQGAGLEGVPRGAVTKLRLFTYHFAFQNHSGGQHRIGTDGPWEPKCILGTVPVRRDGSALFRVPANTPISIQPLDSQGRALQLMRSWTTAMPGEIVSCVGCHQTQNTGPVGRDTLAAKQQPSRIEPWYGAVRGFSFRREVQPVLDEYCTGCHDGRLGPNGRIVSDLRSGQDLLVAFRPKSNDPEFIHGGSQEELVQQYAAVFEPSYFELRRFVRVGGLESDLHVLPPGEFHPDTTELVQILQKGHYGVELDEEAWDRITTWIDLNAPCHGTWREAIGLQTAQQNDRRRRQLRSLYGGVDDDLEDSGETAGETAAETIPGANSAGRRQVQLASMIRPAGEEVDCPGWPFDAAEARRRQLAAGGRTRSLDLGDGVRLDLVLVPAGRFVMGDPHGPDDERPPAQVSIARPFWMGRCEVTNRQYGQFDPTHDSRREHGTASWIGEEAIGPRLNRPQQPVVRVSWSEAVAFCRWLSEKTGLEVSLPAESQWEYACRAGSAGPFSFGDLDTDFSPFANMADATIKTWATFNETRRSADQVPRDERFDDNALVTTDVGSYRPNCWGLHDMHGNAWEWTRSVYRPYPYQADDGRNDRQNDGRRVVRGGSWYDRPQRCRSAYRLSYPWWQKVYNVSFRVVMPLTEKIARNDG